ncbi:ATP-binding cassette domain-containing protein [Rhizobium halophytocola]|uniref:ABC-type bacteriocin/lantibiotic exporter with double-glycine peptidase domain n=1 Tax=Rhizobium halophytocola TaxID=735519 RepID=A0ABS4DVJ5_9HYPH|nr:ATP-binding cassette domain-containing protein [Rhizobium halophytocola]MBP1849720.1 ABC-type bacteriocin/lantibiotic exporter with double-glycine peptidase domain [Rhizobium halophytocola]
METPFAAPVVSLLVMTLALNVLSLSIPLAAQLIFNRILPTPDSPTLPLVVLGVTVIALAEGLIRLSRSFLLLESNKVVAGHLTKRLLTGIVRSDYSAGSRGSARSIDYFSRIAQVAEKQCGKHLVGVAELMFLPIILTLIFYISTGAALLICLVLAAGLYVTVKNATGLQLNTLLLARQAERRYRFLLSILTAVHPLKALGIEDFLLRRYEHIQSGIAITSLKTARGSSRLLNGVLVTNQTIIATSLVYGAYAVNRGELTLGAVSAIVLLGGRLMAPLQRAVFIFIQSRDVCEAEAVLGEAMAHRPTRPATRMAEPARQGRIDISDLAFEVREEGKVNRFSGVDLKAFPGETVAISGGSDAAKTELLRIMAGIIKPATGSILLDDAPIDAFPQDQLNHAVAYVSSDALMFNGTIRDNITRFGEVSIEDTMSVAAIMDLQGAINELPSGLDTKVTGSVNENIPTGLCQQLAILRALVFRPRLILMNNVDRGLDRQGYARLQRFIASIQGQAAIVMVSDDLNLTAGAQRQLLLSEDGLRQDLARNERRITAYRSLKL